MSVLEALKGVLKLALIHDGLARGLREASKALDRRQAHMCVLNENCEEEAYKKLVVALCREHGIPLIKVPDGKLLGEWSGLCEFVFASVPLFSASLWEAFWAVVLWEGPVCGIRGALVDGLNGQWLTVILIRCARSRRECSEGGQLLVCGRPGLG